VAARELFRRPDGRRAGDVDVDVVRVVRIVHDRVRVRAAAGLHVCDVLRIVDVRDVEDPETANALPTHRLTRALGSAIEPRGSGLGGHEQQVLVDGDVALRRGADLSGAQLRRRRIRDIPDLKAVVVALNDIRAGETEVGVGDPGE